MTTVIHILNDEVKLLQTFCGRNEEKNVKELFSELCNEDPSFNMYGY